MSDLDVVRGLRLAAVAERCGYPVKGDRIGKCPSCGESKSGRRLAVSTDANGVDVFHCHGCGIGGSVIDFLGHHGLGRKPSGAADFAAVVETAKHAGFHVEGSPPVAPRPRPTPAPNAPPPTPSAPEGTVPVLSFKHSKDNQGVRHEVNFEVFADWVTKPKPCAAEKGDNPAWMPVDIPDNNRKKGNEVSAVYVLVLDYDDEPNASAERLRDWWGDWWCVGHTTWSHNRDKKGKTLPRWRVVLPLTRPVSPDELKRLGAWAKSRGAGVLGDEVTQAKRFYFSPVSLPGYEYFTNTDAPRFDPDEVLGDAAPDLARDDVVLSTRYHEVADHVAGALRVSGHHLYDRGGVLWLVRNDGKRWRVVPASKHVVADLASRECRFIKKSWTEKGPKEEIKPVPTWLPEWVLANHVHTFPELAAVSRAPGMRPDGGVVTESGYDPATKIHFALPDEARGLKVPKRPTKEQARKALEFLASPFVDFAWADGDVDGSCALACLLTIAARSAIPGPVPMFCVTATAPGSGKSLLVDTLFAITLGKTPPNTTIPPREEELEKRITALMTEAPEVVSFDNQKRPIGSAPLEAVLTSNTWSGRQLGSSTMLSDMPVRTVFMCNGNNLQVKGDMYRRVIAIRLDPRRADPERRADMSRTEAQLRAYTEKNRWKFLEAVFTILRAYHVAGRPWPETAPPMGSYEGWRLVRGALMWLGLEDPARGNDHFRVDGGVDGENASAFFKAWHAHFGEKERIVRDIVAAAEHDRDLRDAIENVLDGAPEGQWRVKLGRWLRRWDGRYLDGLRMRCGGVTRGARRWCVEERGI